MPRARRRRGGACVVRVAFAACTASPKVHGFAGETGTLSIVRRRPRSAWWRRRRRTAVAARGAASRRRRRRAVQGVLADGACEAANARDRLYYVRLPPGYDPARAYRTVYLGPGCGPPQDSTPTVPKAYPMETASDPDAILIAMEQGFYNKAEYNSGDCSDDPSGGVATCATTASTTARARPARSPSSTATSICCTSRSRTTSASTPTGSSTPATPAAAGWRTSSAASSPTCCARRPASRAGCRR